MSNQKILDKINRLVELLLDKTPNPDASKFSTHEQEEFEELFKEIVEYLVWFPGVLFFDKNQARQQANQEIIGKLWESLDSDEIFEELLSGGYSGLLADHLVSFSERVKMLQPIFISINPENTEFFTYFEEAMKAWLYGLPNAALIICFAVIEDLLKDRLCQINISYVYELKDPTNPQGVKQISYNRIIDAANKEELINNSEKKTILDIKDLRNNSIHELQPVSDKEVYNAILDTKNIVEKLLRDS